MKKTMTLACLAVIVAFCGLFSRASAEDGISAGAMTWYAWWSPAYFNPRIDKKLIFLHAKENIKIEPEFLYGPVLSARRGRFSLSSNILTGRYVSVTEQFITDPIVFPLWSPVSIRNRTSKYDTESTLGYQVADWLKVYGGYKHQRYRYRSPLAVFGALGGGLYMPKKTDVDSFSPGIGAGVNVRLAGPLYFLCNLSVVQTSTIARDSGTSALGVIPVGAAGVPMIFPNYDARRYIKGIGVNCAPSLVLLVEPISTTISAGFRYQYVHNFPNKQRLRDDHFYGVTISASYFIGFGGGKENRSGSRE